MKNIKSLSREPWVSLEGKKQLKSWNHQKEVIYNQQLRQALKYEFFIKAVDFIADNKIPEITMSTVAIGRGRSGWSSRKPPKNPPCLA